MSLTGQDAATEPDWWPYVSRRLDVVYYPHPGPGRLYSAPAVVVGPTGSPGTAFYRLTPAVLAWLVAAGRVMEGKWDRDGPGVSVSREDVDEYCRVVGELRAWAAKYLEGGGDVAGVKGELPEVPYIPAEVRR